MPKGSTHPEAKKENHSHKNPYKYKASTQQIETTKSQAFNMIN